MVDLANLKIDRLCTERAAGFARVFAAVIVQYLCAGAQVLSGAIFYTKLLKICSPNKENLSQTQQILG